MNPQEIVSELDKHIVGQAQAKRAVAIALRNRWRRQQVEGDLRREITPKNILMIGPTGVGKTEIARRLARLADAPFIKVEATKFTVRAEDAAEDRILDILIPGPRGELGSDNAAEQPQSHARQSFRKKLREANWLIVKLRSMSLFRCRSWK